jgi:uncharacterized membrane protein
MSYLILGLVIFFAGHAASMNAGLRTSMVNKWGLITYKLLYSVVALIGLYLMVKGFAAYRAGGYIQAFSPPKAMMHINLLLSTLAFIFIVASNLPAGFIKTRLKHPFLVGIKLWAFGHLLANWDLGSLLIFGSFLAYAVINRIAQKAKGIEIAPKPFGLGDILAIVIGLAFAAWFIMHGHLWLIGVPVIAK